MTSAAQQRIHTRVDRRRQPRVEVSLGVKIYKVGDSRPFPAAIMNLSTDGFLVEVPESLFLPDTVEVELPNAGRRQAHVAWSFGEMAGCYFPTPLTKADLSAARLKGTAPGKPDADEPGEAGPVASGNADADGPLETDGTDPVESEAGVSHRIKRWPLGRRLFVIGAMCALPWLFVAGVARLIA